MAFSRSIVASCFFQLAARTYAHPLFSKNDFNVRPFRIDLGDGLPHMYDLINRTHLPDEPEYPGLGDSAGMDLAVLKSLKSQWVENFDWRKEEDYFNTFNHSTVVISNLTTHFIHERSSSPNAIPLVLAHGWPGSFLEFAPIIRSLTEPSDTSSGILISFDVIVPSLPGFAFSEAPPANWTTEDTAQLWHTLVTEVLGYEKYAVHGTDYGAPVAYHMYDKYNSSCRAAHFVFLPFYPKTPEELEEMGIELSGLELEEAERFVEWNTQGNGYFVEQSTKPNTIGLALYDNPVGQLSWIGEKFIAWSDPRQGTGPSVTTHHELLRFVSLYYLTKSFISSVFMYFQNAAVGFRLDYTKARTDAPLLFSAFRYNVGFWPPALVEKVGNLVSYRNHECGGHFPGLDNPPQLLDDLREIGEYWETE